MSEGHRRLARLLADAHSDDGIFDLQAAADHGVSRSALTRLVGDGMLERVAPGHFRATSVPWTLQARQRQWIVRLGDGALLGARSALHHLGIGPRPDRIELVVPRGNKRAGLDIKLIQSTDLLPVDAGVHRGLPTSTVCRALIDAARFLTPAELRGVTSEAIEKRLTDVASLDLRFREVARRGRPGVKRMRACLATFGADPTATVFEEALERLIQRNGFPLPVRQYRVVADGRTYYLDHCWPEHSVWTECDSMLAHGSASALQNDLERQNRIITATGFEPLRFTWADVHERPEYVVELLARHLPRLGAPSSRPGTVLRER